MNGTRRLMVLLVSLVTPIAPPAFAQFGGASTGNVNIRIIYADGHPCGVRAHVQLMEGSSSTSVADAYANELGMTGFNGVRTGTYHIVVSGEGIQDGDSGVFELDTRKVSQSVYITVRRIMEAGAGGPVPTSPVSAGDLNISDKAAKEFDKANDYMAKSNWTKAIDHLNRAIAAYPNYAQAYNNLGFVYGKLGKRPEERVALQKAVSLNDHLAPAYANLARMDIVDRNFHEAEGLLEKSLSADPQNLQTLMLLANVQLLNQHYDDAIGSCRRLHAASTSSHALAHYIAARALEHEQRPADAVGELQTFLQEESVGERADAVRKEIQNVQLAVR